MQQDSSLRFDQSAYIKAGELWRNQSVKVTLKVPVNTRLIINAKMNRYLNNYNLYDCLPDEAEDRDSRMGEWLMSKDGLTCKNDSLYQKNRLKQVWLNWKACSLFGTGFFGFIFLTKKSL